MSTFRQDMLITLDGEEHKCRTRAVDFTNAEQALARDGGSLEKNQMALRFRIAFATFRRCHPEHPAAAAYGLFVDILDEIVEEGQGSDEAGPLDPTRPADSDVSP